MIDLTAVSLILALLFAAPPAPPPAVDRRLTPPADRRDWSLASWPGALHLDASPGDGSHYCGFADRPLCGGQRHRLGFSYLIARGTPVQLDVAVTQYHDDPVAQRWGVLRAGDVARSFAVVGRWQRVDLDFAADPRATTCAVSFKLDDGPGLGECFVADISLRPCGAPITIGP